MRQVMDTDIARPFPLGVLERSLHFGPRTSITFPSPKQ
jgi:hypothetical protein